MNGYMAVILLTALWLLMVCGAYAAGRIRGRKVAEQEQWVSRWLTRQQLEQKIRSQT